MEKRAFLENYRKFPIKLYKKDDGTVFYQNKFLSGTANTINDAFDKFASDEWVRDLYYYYDDVADIRVGSFEPSLTNKKYKGMIYLGQINLQLDLMKEYKDSEHGINYLSKHPEAHDAHSEYMNRLKKQEKMNKWKQNLKDGFNQIKRKIAGVFNPNYQYEMFFPEKTRQDLICEHCGDIIPTATYYEEYEKKPYHLECIWDKLCNNTKHNDHENTIEFFLSLQEQIGRWDLEGVGIEEDYLTDLDLCQVNIRNKK